MLAACSPAWNPGLACAGEEQRFGVHILIPSIAATPSGWGSGEGFMAVVQCSVLLPMRGDAWAGDVGGLLGWEHGEAKFQGAGNGHPWMGITITLAITSITAPMALSPCVLPAQRGDRHHPWGHGDVQSTCRAKAAPVSGGQQGRGPPLLAHSSSLADGVHVAAREEADAPVDLPLPPVGVGAVQDLDDVPAEEGKLGAVVG